MMGRVTSQTPPPIELSPRLQLVRRWAAAGVLITLAAHVVGSSWFDGGAGLDLRVGLGLVTNHWPKAALLLLAYVLLGSGAVARAWWKHRATT